MTQCNTHIQQKLWKGKGNGSYQLFVLKKEYLSVARTDLKNLYNCVTKAQFVKYTKLMKFGWSTASRKGTISPQLIVTFFKVYIDNPLNSNWSVSSGGLFGYNPSNQATERSMESIKGSKDFEGYMLIKHSIGTML